jgi:hypothetical protein
MQLNKLTKEILYFTAFLLAFAVIVGVVVMA